MKSSNALAKLSCTLVLLFWTLFLYSQKKKDQSYFHISVGSSFPLGKYGNGEDYSRRQGYAKTGGSIKLSGTTMLKKNFGLNASLQFQINPLNTASLEKDIWKVGYWEPGQLVFTDTGIVPSTEPPPRTSRYKNWEVDKSSWYVGSLMVGGFKQFPFNGSKSLSAFIEGNIGLAFAWSPEINARSVSDTGIVQIKQYKNSGMGFSYSLGAGLNYGLKGKTNLRLNIDYFGTSKIKFASMRTVENGQITAVPVGSAWSYSMKRDGKIPISSINVGVGLSFQL